MKDFELEDIGRKMPYQAPAERFFEDFTEDIMAKVAQEEPQGVTLHRLVAPFLSIAALLAIVLTVTLTGNRDRRDPRGEYIISESVNDSVDSFLNTLSDEEIATLAANNTYYDDFYLNLPIN